MSLLSSLATDSSIANERDSVGGSRVMESGLVNFTVALAYITKSTGGALALNLNLKSDGGQELRQQLWMTSSTAKGGKNYYEDRNGEKQYLPGFVLANSLALLTLGKELAELDTEQKVVNLWSSDAKAEVPTKVDMVVDLLGTEIIGGVIKQIVDRTAKNDATGEYLPTGETREENEIDKFFRMKDRKTTAEIRAQSEEATFIDTWGKKWTGQTRNRAKGTAAGGTAGAPKAAGAATAAKKPATSLFA